MWLPAPPESNVIRLMGIDPGTDTLGVCIMDIDLDTYAATVVWGHTYHASRTTDRWAGYGEIRGMRDARLKSHQYELSLLLRAVEPTLIAAETPFFNRKRPSAFEALVECYAMLRDTVWEYSPTLVLNRIDPVMAKNYIGVDHRGTDKSDVQRAVAHHYASRCASGIDIHRFDEHTIDAVAICNALLRNTLLGEVVERTKKTKRVGSKPRGSKLGPAKTPRRSKRRRK